jgi:hypothetical protein
MFSTNHHALATEEIPRMETVMKNFAVYRWVLPLSWFCAIVKSQIEKGVK